MKENMIVIETVRDTYGAEDLRDKTLTAGELAEIFNEVAEVNPNVPVILSFDGGYTYGKITEGRIVIDEQIWDN